MTFTLAAAQFAPTKGAVAANLDRVAEATQAAVAEGADVVAFPESVVTGYYLEGGADQRALSPEELREGLAKRLSGLERPVDVLVGFYERAVGQPFNSAAYMTFSGGLAQTVHVYRKFFLPTYGLFDEDRFHQRGTELGVFDTRFGRFGVLICEDVWHSILGTLLALNGAEVVFVPSASPVRGLAEGKPGNVLRYERMLRELAEEHGLFTVAAMLTGLEGGKALSGGSMVFDPFGAMMVQAPVGEDAIVMAEVDLEVVALARSKTPLLADLRSSWGLVSRLVVETEP